MSQLAGIVMSTDGPAGRAGFRRTAVCMAYPDNPPALLICINRSSSAYRMLFENAVVCVNTLSAGQQPLSQLFGQDPIGGVCRRGVGRRSSKFSGSERHRLPSIDYPMFARST